MIDADADDVAIGMDLMVRHAVIPHRCRRCRDLLAEASEVLVKVDPDTLRVRDDG